MTDEEKSPTPGTVQIHGEEYKLIATRLALFREDHPNWAIEPQILSDDEVVKCRTEIRDEEGRLISVGHAEEVREHGNINRVSAVENCETSSVGRALAWVSGKYAGKTIRSAEEMADAIAAQKAVELIEYMKSVREHWDTINAIKRFLIPIWGDTEDKINASAAREAFKELDVEIQQYLWKAPTKGGVFTTLERDMLKTPPEDSI